MKAKKIIILAVIIVVAITFVTIALFFHTQNNAFKIPDEITDLIEEYMAAYKEGVEKSVELAYFNDEFVKQAYIESGDKLLDYNIQSIKKINDDLYELNVLMKSIQSTLNQGDDFQLVYNFAARIDGQWRFLNGVSHIPEELRENLDAGKYVYDDKNILEWRTEQLN